jgi:hypothetical protein
VLCFFVATALYLQPLVTFHRPILCIITSCQQGKLNQNQTKSPPQLYHQRKTV